MPDHLAVPKQEPSARPWTDAPVRPAEDKRLEGNQAQSRLERQRKLLDRSPRVAQLREQTHLLESCGEASPAPRQGGASGLPAPLKTGVESLSGMAMEKPGVRRKSGPPVNDDLDLEREADVMGARAAGHRAAARRPAASERSQPAALRPVASQRPVQRKIIVDEEEIGEDKSAVQRFFARHGIHYYYAYDDLLGYLSGDKKVRTLREKNDAADLIAEMMERARGRKSVAQDGVQRKLVEIAELFRRTEDDKAAIPEEYKEWYDGLIQNGLCLGFVKVFEQHPDWTLAMWEALETWEPKHGVSIEESLKQLNDHIEAHMGFGDGLVQQNFLEAVLLAREAWDHMKEEDDYQDVPALIGEVTGTGSDHESTSIDEKTPDTKFAAKGSQSERWALVLEHILKNVGASGSYHIIVWHADHEMAIRCVLEKGRLTELIAVETEGMGMKSCASWDQVGAIIGPRLMDTISVADGEDGMKEKEITEFAVDIKRQEEK